MKPTRGSTTNAYRYGPDGAKLGWMSGQTLGQARIPLPGGGEAVSNAAGLEFYRHRGSLTRH